MYAIIDIETTGGNATTGKITEIAIIIHDGKNVVKQFSTLVNPKCSIPYFITQHTGITDDMVKDAPEFHEIAKEIIELTEDCVFVAHNVGFDYGFIKSAFKDLGYSYQRKTLCTVRLSRSTFVGLPSYSLGNLCKSLGIQLKNRHRALGDAEATALLFSMILENATHPITPQWISTESKKTAFPPLLSEENFKKIPPFVTGIYYFHNQNGDVIYVGKSKDIKKRILQHFANQNSKKAVRMQHEIADISFENTGSELVALLLESDEIKKLRPLYNTSQKRTRSIPYYGIYQYLDIGGYINLKIERLKEGVEQITTADNLFAAKNIIYKVVEKNNLCLSKCDLHNVFGPCFNYQIHKCNGACVHKEDSEIYNKRVFAAIDEISFNNESFFIIDNGRTLNEKSIVFIEKGQYKGFGYIDSTDEQTNINDFKDYIKRYNHNKDIQNILIQFMKKGIKKKLLEHSTIE